MAEGDEGGHRPPATGSRTGCRAGFPCPAPHPHTPIPLPICLTVAGSDPSGGAGLQADLRVFHRLGCYGLSVAAAVTAQNTLGVSAWEPVTASLVEAQLETLLSDFSVAAAKTGMLAGAAQVEAVADVLARRPIPHLVVDPVLRAKDGVSLLDGGGLLSLRERLLPMAELVTPNLEEAAELLGEGPVGAAGSGILRLRSGQVSAQQWARQAARRLGERCRGVLLKGGHLPGKPVDLLFYQGSLIELVGTRLPGPPVHGTGCVLSAAIAAYLARGEMLPEAVRKARRFLRLRMRRAAALGGGNRLIW